MITASRLTFNNHKGMPSLQYVVHGNPPVVLQIDIFNPSLATLFKMRMVKSCTFMTVENPFDEPVSQLANNKLQIDFVSELKRRSLNYSEGETRHLIGQRPSQESFLVWGLSLEAAKVLAIKFGQKSIVWCGLDAVPRLLVL